jgi:myo-inositol-1(or 4)-monophosphatase
MDEIARRLVHARGIARSAGALALDHFRMREELVVETKADPQDVFTRADREVEAHLRERIAETFPADGFLGEETGLSEAESRYHWVVDPIDGTSPFIAGLDAWCVSISILEDKRVVAGVIHMPVAGELFASRKGEGTTLNDAPLRLVRPSSL